MQVFHTDAHIPHIIGQILCHPFGQGCHQHLIVFIRFFPDFSHKVINLPFHRPYHNLRIQQPGRTDNLFRPQQLMSLLIGRRSGGYKKQLINMRFKLFKIKRPVIQRRRQTETIIHQRHLSGTIPCVHSSYLRNGDMGFIDHNQEIIPEEIQKGHGRFSRSGAIQMPGVIFDSGTEPGLPQHLNVKIGSF